ncbi:MAG TPA: TonB-dependent receptor [Chitinophagaceae bacterium]|nr:TonB-dependent receptor [Chitinophagaceae bacterium]
MNQKLHFRFSLTLLCSFFSLCAWAHNGSIKGYVYNGTGRKPLEGANIYIRELKISAVTDGFGAFFLKNISEGKFTLVINHVGFESREETLKIEDGVTTDFTAHMLPIAININEVTINAKKDLTLSSISGVDLKSRPINSSQDLLRLVPGMFISQHQGGGKAEQMFLRGFDVDHGTDVHLSVDGMPINMVSHAHGQGYADAHFIIPETVEKLNYGKGPYAIDKGNFATAGWVEYKTKTVLDNSFIKAEAGTYGYVRTLAGINILDKNAGKANQEAYVMGEFNYNNSYFDAPQNFNRFNLIGKYTNYLDKNKILSVTLSGFSSGWDASGQIPDRAVAQGIISRFGKIDDEAGKTSRYNANVQYYHAINNRSSFKSNLYFSKYDFELFSNFTFFLRDTVNGDQIKQKDNRITAGYNAAYNTEYLIGSVQAKTEAGIGFRYDDATGSELSHTRGMKTLLERLAYGDIRETNLFSYVNQTFYLTPQLVLNAGSRYDYFIQEYKNLLPADPQTSINKVGRFSPKTGLYYNFTDRARVYANYGIGFHSNDTRVVIAQDNKQILPAAYSSDLGTVIKPTKKLLLSAAVWMLDLQQEFVYVGDEAVVEPSGRTRRYGFDVSARYDIFKWLYLDADVNYAHARARDELKGEDYIPLAAKITSIGGATVKFSKYFSTGLRFRHIGDRPANEDNSVVAKGYTVFDMVAAYTRKSYELGLQIQNLTNTKWNEAQFDTETRLRNEVTPVSEICFTPGTPFFIKLTAAYKF